MSEQTDHVSHFITRNDQPLIGIILQEEDQEVVRYFTEEAEADTAISSRAIEQALSLAGSWSHLDWDEMEQELQRIRHESQPTPPISL